jgi:hypothetical protein
MSIIEYSFSIHQKKQTNFSGEFGDLFINGQYQQTDDDESIQVNYLKLFRCFILIFLF